MQLRSLIAKLCRPIAFIAPFVVLIYLSPGVAEACPGCKAALNNAADRGFNYSILFMLIMPFAIFGSVFLGILFMRRNGETRAKDHHEPDSETQTEGESN